MKFTWDPVKAESNIAKHGIDFREAATTFLDPLSTTFPDVDHSLDEERFSTIGMSAHVRILVVSHTESEDNIRIISAGQATKHEQNF